MVRRLPWEQAAGNGSGPPPSSTPARPRRPKPIIDSSDIEQTPHRPTRTYNALTAEPIHEHPHERARSSSAPLGPPREELMVEGWDNDDRYRMVEDEFLDIAKDFTQHLHAAEYLRLKAAARNQSSSAVGEISRPVTGSMPDATKRKLESIERSKRQASAVAELKKQKPRDLDISDEEAPEPWLGTALHGLMEEPRAKVPTVTDLVDTAASTKAARGYKGDKLGRMDDYGMGSGSDTDQAPPGPSIPSSTQQDIDTESDEDDDLDGPPVARQTVQAWQRKLPVSPGKSRGWNKVEVEAEPELPPPRRQHRPSVPAEERTEAVKKEDADIVELPRTSADILVRMAKRRELTRRKREREVDDAKRAEVEAKKRRGGGVGDVIPTFL